MDRSRRPATIKTSLNIWSWFFTLSKMLFFGAFIAVIYWTYLKLTSPDAFPFRKVKVQGIYSHINPAKLSQVVNQDLNGGFFSLDIDQMESDLMGIPWVATVSIRRVWPDTLLVIFSEKKPIASWNNQKLITPDAATFVPEVGTTFPSHLPQLYGPEEHIDVVIQEYFDLTKKLAPLHLGIQNLALSPRMSWSMQLSNGVFVTLGQEDLESRMTKFTQAYPLIIGSKSDQVESINMCYSNGLAVKWKKNAIENSDTVPMNAKNSSKVISPN